MIRTEIDGSDKVQVKMTLLLLREIKSQCKKKKVDFNYDIGRKPTKSRT